MKSRSLSQKPSLNVVIRTNPPVDAVITQINELDQDQLSEVIRAIASRINTAE